ncbi:MULTISPECIES: hypothetical protein [unclassified Streptomyces]|uniref:hypothetical protein n=1 Tax=unclassified Streptomyces TaxID=2593676 RepID=UPI002DD9BF26|nr:hypothetical protein [Streptomyces sp. NBC_01237]WRZ74513.1 hypothetical protein OG251_24500 [Streptomyces sp. NBC_01237]
MPTAIVGECDGAVQANTGTGPRHDNGYARGASVDFAIAISIIISVIIVAGSIAYIVYLFFRDQKIWSQGRDIRVLVEDVRHVGTNDSGSVTIDYRLSWNEGGVVRHVEGRDTILAIRSSAVQKGCEVDIRYVDDDHLLFVFDK